ncbi:hypothetical protein SDC9_100533 [bioreactor metagenome]|uniref:Uncharacterized protein n=1 Tax=bioreactor metagenome TaxID=1076179 RepID=A0A645AW46_9ZZZZ
MISVAERALTDGTQRVRQFDGAQVVVEHKHRVINAPHGASAELGRNDHVGRAAAITRYHRAAVDDVIAEFGGNGELDSVFAGILLGVTSAFAIEHKTIRTVFERAAGNACHAGGKRDVGEHLAA